jgi:O-antigen ligase
MTTAGEGAASRDILGVWCGAVLVFGAALTPVLAWIAPLGFAALVALMGLLSLPAVRLRAEDRPVMALLFAGLLWAAVTTSWTPFHPKHTEDSTILKLALQLPLYWSAICGARRAAPSLQRLAMRVLAFGVAGLGVLMAAEAFTDGELYFRLHEAYYEPIRRDLAGKNLGQTCFVLALLWPLAAAGARRAGAPGWLAVPMVAGLLAAAFAFKADAPVIALGLVVAAGLATLRWPNLGPKVVGGLGAFLFLAMPALVVAVRETLRAANAEVPLPLSYSMRVGYWRHALDWIAERPLRGWGLDASRAFSPGIQLHPHNGPLQVWLELGVLGALAAAAFWWLALSKLSRPRPDMVRAAAVGTAATYLLFGGVNFGLWQEWWLGLGALVVLVTATLGELKVKRPST